MAFLFPIVAMQTVIDAVFAPAGDPRAARAAKAWIALLFIGGLIGWAYVMGFGRAPLDFHDWTGITLPRLQFLQNALRAGEWPLHMAGNASLHGVTDRFLTLPDVITTESFLYLELWKQLYDWGARVHETPGGTV